MNALFAEATRSATLSESFRSHAGMGRDDVLLGLLMAVTLVAGLWAATRLLGMRRRRRGYHNPWQLFRALCKANHLTWSDRILLTRVARQQSPREPARLFLEMQLWDEQALGPTFALEFVRLRTLRKQLFDRPIQSKAIETGARRTAIRARDTVPLRNPEAKPAAKGSTPAASPLFASPAVPTLDLPPWNDVQNVS
jgi:hypothetical protein